MTNDMIIFTQSQKLAKEGKIKYTGRVFRMMLADGQEIEAKETEQIHTFAHWKENGYKVKKGSKAVSSFPIWKHVSGKKTLEDDTEVDTSKMFMKVAAFFSESQVERMVK